MSHKFAQSTSLLQTTDLIFLGDLEKVDENKAEFENSDNLGRLEKKPGLNRVEFDHKIRQLWEQVHTKPKL